MAKITCSIFIFSFLIIPECIFTQTNPDYYLNESLEKNILMSTSKYLFRDVSNIEDSLFIRPIQKWEPNEMENEKHGKALFKSIINGIHNSFLLDSTRSFSEARRFFTTADSVTRAHGIQITSVFSNSLHQELNSLNPKFDCDLMMLVYSTASQAYPFKIRFSYCPGPHVFARYMLNDSTYYNWDSNLGKNITDVEYRTKYFEIDNSAYPWHGFLETIGSKQALSIIFYNEGSNELSKGNYSKAIKYLDIANALVPRFKLFVNEILTAFDLLKRWSQLKTYAAEIIDFDSTCYIGYFYKGRSYSGMNQSDSALFYYSKAIEKNPDLGRLYYARGVEYLKIKIMNQPKRILKT
jgi:tetratricopeptide (TPR) repeat protein